MHFYQLASMVESGGTDLDKFLQIIRNTSIDLMEILDKAIEDSNLITFDDVVYDPEHESLFMPIEVNPETLSMIEDYLKNSNNTKNTTLILC